MHQVDDPREHVRIGLGEHAVAEVEDVALGGGALGEDAADLAVDDVPAGEQQRRVEVALQRPGPAAAGGGDVQRQPPVDPDDVGAGLAHGAQQLAGADPEVDARQAGVGQPLQHAGGVREHQLAVVALRERAGPGVEELHGVDAGVDLRAQERQRRVGEVEHSACQVSGSACISALVRSWLRLGPPSTR